MATYATFKDVKNLKTYLKKEYNKHFKITKLTEEEKNFRDNIKLFKALHGKENLKEKLGEKNINEIKAINTKLNGVELNPDIKNNLLKVLHRAYMDHFDHTKPKWYQLKKRFVYWREKKAINSFEKMLIKKKFTRDDLIKVREDARENAKCLDVPAKPQCEYMERSNNRAKTTVLVEGKDVKNQDFLTMQNNTELSKNNVEFVNS